MKIALLGDIGLLGNYSLANNPELIKRLKPVSDFLGQFDLVIGNLETPFSYKKKTWGAKSAYICTDPMNIDVLKSLHINAVTIANNHMYDFGSEGFKTTISTLESNGIDWFGADGKVFKVEAAGNRLLFNGFCCYSTNPLKLSSHFGAQGINRFNLKEVTDILKSKSDEGWLNILAIHSGIEHVNTPSVEQILAAHVLADVASFVWYGHHPHVVQGIENIGDSLIAHSLGNFCFAGNYEDKNRPTIELSENNRNGMILVLEVENNKILDYKTYITAIKDDGTIVLLTENTVVNTYSTQIKEYFKNPEAYKENRMAQRSKYLSRRKEMRNLKWFLKRLRPRYAKLMLDNRRNAKKYHKSLTNQLKTLGYEL